VVVVVLWQKKPIICMDCPQYFHNVKEDVTDVNGGFYIDESRGINFNPLTRVVDAVTDLLRIAAAPTAT